jgi:2Fe-2S ferredoxin
MPLVVFESRAMPPLEADCPEGGRLMDLCDERTAPVPFSCRGATCGSCRIEVIEGVVHLAPPTPRECETLAIFEDDPSKRRLACQARLLPGEGLVRLRPV